MLPAYLHRFRPRLADTLADYDRRRFAADLGAGLTVGVVALPLAMAFAIASGVKPEQGLVTAIIAGFLISALGGSQVQIGGPAGAFIVIVYGIVERYGLANLLISTMLAGVLLFALGWLKLGALVRYIPVSIVIGFTNGIAVLIGLSQVKDLLGLQIDKLPADFFTQIRTLLAHVDTLNLYALVVGLLSLLLVVLWPKSYRMDLHPHTWQARFSRWAAHLPGTLVVLVLATVATALFELPVETIGSRFGSIPQSMPPLALPELSWASAKQLLIPTVTIALLGAIESLLCARVADNMSEFQRHDPNQELMAQGVANFAAPLFGGIPATGTIARTVTNVRAGAQTPVAGMIHAVVLLGIMLLAAPLALHVPLAALAGILLFVAWNMGEWHEFTRLRDYNLPYRTVLLGTFVLTVVFDLTVAVEVGLILACVFFIWRMGQNFQLRVIDTPLPEAVTALSLQGALFFGSVGKVEALAESQTAGTRRLVLDLDRLVWMDTSGLDALRQLHRQLSRRGIELCLTAAQAQAASLLRRSGLEAELGPRGAIADRAAALALAAPVSPPEPLADALPEAPLAGQFD
ncbi:MAG: STAS domain-containing protein [Burkholderiales bacterium]|nr:STAS domain-containing protein [Burkholderiales bacterium]